MLRNLSKFQPLLKNMTQMSRPLAAYFSNIPIPKDEPNFLQMTKQFFNEASKVMDIP